MEMSPAKIQSRLELHPGPRIRVQTSLNSARQIERPRRGSLPQRDSAYTEVGTMPDRARRSQKAADKGTASRTSSLASTPAGSAGLQIAPQDHQMTRQAEPALLPRSPSRTHMPRREFSHTSPSSGRSLPRLGDQTAVSTGIPENVQSTIPTHHPGGTDSHRPLDPQSFPMTKHVRSVHSTHDSQTHLPPPHTFPCLAGPRPATRFSRHSDAHRRRPRGRESHRLRPLH